MTINGGIVVFVFSFKANKPKIIIALCIVIGVLVAGTLALNGRRKPVVNDNTISYKAKNAEDCISFLSQFGWTVNEEPIEVREVIIPSEFNDTYTAYNVIQKNQNLDLEPYKGFRAKKWTFEIKNYPGYPADCGYIRATLLVYDGCVIGGDISSTEQNGFVQGFEFPNTDVTAPNRETSSQEAGQ